MTYSFGHDLDFRQHNVDYTTALRAHEIGNKCQICETHHLSSCWWKQLLFLVCNVIETLWRKDRCLSNLQWNAVLSWSYGSGSLLMLWARGGGDDGLDACCRWALSHAREEQHLPPRFSARCRCVGLIGRWNVRIQVRFVYSLPGMKAKRITGIYQKKPRVCIRRRLY